MEITTTGTESTITMHFDTRLTFEVDQDGKVINGTQTFTEQQLFEMLQPKVEEVEEEEVSVVSHY
jgi:hypothetical protein